MLRTAKLSGVTRIIILYSITAVILSLQVTDSYILLTANFEDVQSIVKQLAESPVADQVKQIWRRAATQFNQYIVKNKPQMRASVIDPINNDELPPRDDEGASRYFEGDGLARRSDAQTEGPRNASYYLSSIKKIMDAL
ncbi:hypothetical protein evm_013607 [Chilo suppressalis]|nr:hypothetical protein evm_013607 [Chilo suppressalis]